MIEFVCRLSTQVGLRRDSRCPPGVVSRLAQAVREGISCSLGLYLRVTTRPVTGSKAAQRVKALYDNSCQVCGQAVPVLGKRYCEAVPIRPLGDPHQGSDSVDNMLCLCPNHRVMFEYGTFGVGDDHSLLGIRLYRRLQLSPEHGLDEHNLRYHREHIMVG